MKAVSIAAVIAALASVSSAMNIGGDFGMGPGFGENTVFNQPGGTGFGGAVDEGYRRDGTGTGTGITDLSHFPQDLVLSPEEAKKILGEENSGNDEYDPNVAEYLGVTAQAGITDQAEEEPEEEYVQEWDTADIDPSQMNPFDSNEDALNAPANDEKAAELEELEMDDDGANSKKASTSDASENSAHHESVDEKHAAKSSDDHGAVKKAAGAAVAGAAGGAVAGIVASQAAKKTQPRHDATAQPIPGQPLPGIIPGAHPSTGQDAHSESPQAKHHHHHRHHHHGHHHKKHHEDSAKTGATQVQQPPAVEHTTPEQAHHPAHHHHHHHHKPYTQHYPAYMSAQHPQDRRHSLFHRLKNCIGCTNNDAVRYD